MWNLSNIEDYSLMLAALAHARPEDDYVFEDNLLRTPKTTGFASMVLGGEPRARLPEGLKKHRWSPPEGVCSRAGRPEHWRRH